MKTGKKTPLRAAIKGMEPNLSKIEAPCNIDNAIWRILHGLSCLTEEEARQISETHRKAQLHQSSTSNKQIPGFSTYGPLAPPAIVRHQGRPRLDLKSEEIRLPHLLWPEFSRQLKKSRGVAALWRVLPHKRSYFICLSSVVFFPDIELGKQSLIICFQSAPDLTCMVLPRLRRRRAKFDLSGKHRAALSNPIDGNQKTFAKISAQDADLRRMMRDAAADFMARTAD